MIELKDVHKTYKSKKGKSTKALDGISVTFDEKGITFILGKSGSGKSTLLNVLGGLDQYDSGDMLIFGKSSKDFTQADFDSYRNTYVGFIFQEFNILEDYDVYQNIVLALQLQQKEVNESEIDQLLDQLELTELKKRKVNELSGGQKQRVAIARALIKEPKIILADEPTGNLDSKTGRQVMELLKDISKEKLVVIVSHDEEYAETYGDRIIEVKDGQVIRDTKEVVNKERKSTYETIKSHLPFQDSFKLGLGSLKHKKVKLAFTVFLTVLTLGFLSCTDTLSSYDFSLGHAKLLSDRKEQFVQVEKRRLVTDPYDGRINNSILLRMDDDALQTVRNRMNSKAFYEVYRYRDVNSWSDYDTASTLLHVQDDTNFSYYEDNSLELVACSDVSKILKEEVIGRMPNGPFEIVISNSLADTILKHGIEVYETVTSNEFTESKIFKPTTYDEILNTNYTYYFGSNEKIKIVGIINYDLSSVSNLYQNNVLNKVYVHEDFVSNLKILPISQIKNDYSIEISLENKEESTDGESMSSSSTSLLDHPVEYFDGVTWRTTDHLNDNEIILNIYEVDPTSSYQNDLSNYISKHYDEDYDTLTKRFLGNYIQEKNVIGSKVRLDIYSYTSSKALVNSYSDLVVVGVYYRDDNSSMYSGGSNYVSSSLLEEYTVKQVERTSVLYPMTTKNEFKHATDTFPIDSDLAIRTTYGDKMAEEKVFFDSIQTLAFYAGIVFIVFTVFLIINFMYTSIHYRKREIGVLRALGARSLDVMKIFLWEGVCLSVLSGTIASILLVVVSNVMNSFVMTRFSGMLTTPFIVGIRQFVVIYLLVFVVTFISSILPLIRISKMKPIDAILNK